MSAHSNVQRTRTVAIEAGGALCLDDLRSLIVETEDWGGKSRVQLYTQSHQFDGTTNRITVHHESSTT